MPQIGGRRKGVIQRFVAITSGVISLPIKIPASSLALTALAGILLATPALVVVNIDYSSIGNAGNANDAATGSFYSTVALSPVCCVRLSARAAEARRVVGFNPLSHAPRAG